MLNEFISKVKSTGLAKTNRYRVTIATPSLMTGLMNSGRLITLFCESTSLPGQVIATTEQRIMGETREFPYMKNYDNIPMSFYIDNNFEVKAFFDNWLKYISNHNNKITGYYLDYISPTIEIDVLPMDSESPTHTVILHEAYPKAISNIVLSANARDVAKITVSMNYKYYTTTETSVRESLSSSGGIRPNQPLNIQPDAFQDRPQFLTASGFSGSYIKTADQFGINSNTDPTEYFTLLATDLIQTQGRFAELYAFS
jgi:hypothetical protein